MKTLPLLLPAVLAVFLAPDGLLTSAWANKPGDTLIDFVHIQRDGDGTEYRPFEYVWNDWDKHVNIRQNLGAVLKAANGKGTMGENNTGVEFEGSTAIQLLFVIGNGNQEKGLSFYLEDKDGTSFVWNIPLEGKPRGQELRYTMELTKPDSIENAGKTPGLNLKKIKVWQLRGDYQASAVEILLIKLIRAQ